MAGARVRIFKALLAVVAITTRQATIEILIEIATKTAGIGIDLQIEVAPMIVAITTLQATIEILIEIATMPLGIGIDLQMEVATMSAGLGVATEALVGQGATAIGGDRRPTPS